MFAIPDLYLYNRIKELGLTSLNNDFQEFFAEYSASSAGFLSELGDDFDRLRNDMVSNYINDIRYNDSLISTYSDSLNLLYELLDNGSNPNLIDQYIANLKGSIENAAQINDSLGGLIEKTNTEQLLPILVRNMWISTVDLQEHNEQFVNEVYFKNIIAGISISEDQYNLLLVIANTCPLIGGTSVYRARSILSNLTVSLSWNDDSLCVSQGIAPRYASKSINHTSDISVFPNPTNGIVSFEISGEIIGEIILYDVFGKVIQKYLVNKDEKMIQFNLSNINSSVVIYSYKNSILEKHGKITLVR